jgi:hypothetical protein
LRLLTFPSHKHSRVDRGDQVFIHLLNFLLALAPSDKRGAPPPFNLYAEIGDAGSVAQAAERARHEEIVVKAISGLLLLLLKHTRANHPIQAAYLQSVVALVHSNERNVSLVINEGCVVVVLFAIASCWWRPR